LNLEILIIISMKKSIIFCAILALDVILAVLEFAFTGLPEPNYPILTVCGILLCAGLVYLRVSLYKTVHILWCLFGGIALTFLVTFGAHLAYCLPMAIDYFNLGALASLLLVILTALYVTGVYAASLYLFVFYFCEVRDRIRDFE